MNGEQFAIEVRDGKVFGRLDPGDRRSEGDTAKIDEHVLATVTVLEDWLKRWKWITELRSGGSRRPLLVPNTFMVLGTHLWRLVLQNDVGTALIAARDAVPEGGAPLRVTLTFDDSDTAKKLARLPWEFLYYPGSTGQEGYYLATEGSLVLSRYLPRGAGRPTMTPAEKPRVIFWTLPEGSDFEDERTMFEATRKGLAAQYEDELDVREMIDGWHPEDVVRQLDSKADIVHVIGVCRIEDDSPKLYISKDTWVYPQQLVNALTAKKGSRPELVVLHLCDWPGSNANENFEHLAPSLVLADIPAVLAMQYPMAPGDTESFISKFYDRLIEGDDIGKAVQTGREQMKFSPDGSLDRRFGAPVLYLQSADGCVLSTDPTSTQAQSGLGTVATNAPVPPAATTPGRRIPELLLAAVEYHSPDLASAREFAEWINARQWPDDRDEAWKIVKSRQRDHQNDADLQPLFAAMLRATGAVR